MRKILDCMSVDEVRAFVASKPFLFFREYLTDKRESAIDIMKTLDKSGTLFAMVGELTAVDGLLALLTAFNEVIHPKPNPQAEAVDNPLELYGSDKPAELTKIIEVK